MRELVFNHRSENNRRTQTCSSTREAKTTSTSEKGKNALISRHVLNCLISDLLATVARNVKPKKWTLYYLVLLKYCIWFYYFYQLRVNPVSSVRLLKRFQFSFPQNCSDCRTVYRKGQVKTTISTRTKVMLVNAELPTSRLPSLWAMI